MRLYLQVVSLDLHIEVSEHIILKLLYSEIKKLNYVISVLLERGNRFFGILGFGFRFVFRDGLELKCRAEFFPARRRVAAAQADTRSGHDDVSGWAGATTMALHHRPKKE